MTNHKKGCLSISCKQGSNMQFSNYLKKLQALFVTYAEFKSNFKKFNNIIEILLMHLLYENIKNILLAVRAIRLYVLTIDLLSQCKYIKVKMQFTGLLKTCLKKLSIVKKL